MRIRREGLTLVEIAGAAIVLIAALAIAVPRAIRKFEPLWAEECRDNLIRIDMAKEQWALENGKGPFQAVRKEDLWRADGGWYLSEWPNCPKGYPYQINEVGEDPECTSGLPDHALGLFDGEWIHPDEFLDERSQPLEEASPAGPPTPAPSATPHGDSR